MYLFGDKTVFFNNVGIRRKIGVTATTEVPLLCQSKISPLIRTLIEKDQRFFLSVLNDHPMLIHLFTLRTALNRFNERGRNNDTVD